MQQRGFDAQKIINKLTERIGQLMLENSMLQVRVEELEAAEKEVTTDD